MYLGINLYVSQGSIFYICQVIRWGPYEGNNYRGFALPFQLRQRLARWRLRVCLVGLWLWKNLLWVVSCEKSWCGVWDVKKQKIIWWKTLKPLKVLRYIYMHSFIQKSLKAGPEVSVFMTRLRTTGFPTWCFWAGRRRWLRLYGTCRYTSNHTRVYTGSRR
jgi:hypothetical protein